MKHVVFFAVFSLACSDTTPLANHDTMPMVVDMGSDGATTDLSEGTTPSGLIGLIVNGSTGEPLAGATIQLQTCAECEPMETTSWQDKTNAGSFSFSEQPEPTNDALAVGLRVSAAGYEERIFYFKPKYQDGIANLGSLRLYPEGSADSDSDGLMDEEEEAVGLDPQNGDTDKDGIPDGYEVNGYKWVDYQDLGCDPKMRDLLVEVDYHHYEEDGVTKSAMFSEALITKAKQFFAALPIDTPLPSGAKTTGIAIHFVHDTPLPKSHQCYHSASSVSGDKSDANPLFKETFHKATICIGAGSGYRGHSPISGRSLKFFSPNTDQDPENNWQEKAQFLRLAVFTHELGHSLGLTHGGNQNLNFKPNYTGLMNYAYDSTYNGKPQTLEGTEVHFSDGTFPSLDEAALIEVAPFPGYSLEELSFLSYFQSPYIQGKGFPIELCPAGNGEVCVDWNKDGIYQDESYQLKLTDGTSFVVLADHNDFKAIGKKMARALVSDPN
jgi:hypothetical protein